jgi:hypothetical protein
MELPRGLKPVGPYVADETILQSVATALHVSVQPITGQIGSRSALERNPGVFLNPEQPLVQVCRNFENKKEILQQIFLLSGCFSCRGWHQETRRACAGCSQEAGRSSSSVMWQLKSCTFFELFLRTSLFLHFGIGCFWIFFLSPCLEELLCSFSAMTASQSAQSSSRL